MSDSRDNPFHSDYDEEHKVELKSEIEDSKSTSKSGRLPEFRMANTNSYGYWKNVEDGLKLEGRSFQTGHFTHAENLQLKNNWRKLIKKFPLDEPQLLLRKTVRPEFKEVIKEFISDNNFYIRLGHKINRSPYNVYVRARKIFNFAEKTGTYTTEEEERLKALESKHGRKWEEIGRIMGRSGHSALKKAHVLDKQIAKGRWTNEEDMQLEKGVTAVMNLNNNNHDKGGTQEAKDVNKIYFNMPWIKIAEYVPTRNSKQCRDRWIIHQQGDFTGLKWRKRNRRFSQSDRLKLTKEIKSLKVKDESRIDWEYIHSKFPEVPSPQYLKLKWYGLKKTVLDRKVKHLDRILNDVIKNLSAGLIPSDSESDGNENKTLDSKVSAGNENEKSACILTPNTSQNVLQIKSQSRKKKSAKCARNGIANKCDESTVEGLCDEEIHYDMGTPAIDMGSQKTSKKRKRKSNDSIMQHMPCHEKCKDSRNSGLTKRIKLLK